MKESLLGLTTMAILFGLVWLSQGEIYKSQKNLTENITHEENNQSMKLIIMRLWLLKI